jgi:hypothetical protein
VDQLLAYFRIYNYWRAAEGLTFCHVKVREWLSGPSASVGKASRDSLIPISREFVREEFAREEFAREEFAREEFVARDSGK